MIWLRLLWIWILLSHSSLTFSETFTIFHTNDEHSRFLGFAPNSEYNPNTVGDGTIGGVARLAHLLKERKKIAESRGPVLILESGDFSMGTLFHTIAREKGAELQMLQHLQYDAITFGNHEFDFGVKGLSQMIHSGLREAGKLPSIVASNLVLTKDNPADEGLRQLTQQGVIKPYTIIEKQKIRFGIIGILGPDGIQVTPLRNYAPVQFDDPISTVKKYVKILKEKEKVDYIIVLSHGGVTREDHNWTGTELLKEGDDGKWIGEDIDLAKSVPDIDVIISGHTHTPLIEPIKVGKTSIVQAGSDIRYLGELEISKGGKQQTKVSYTLHPINDSIPGDAETTKKVEQFKLDIDNSFLKPIHATFNQATAKINKTITRNYSDMPLGNLLSEAFQKGSGADIGFCPDGVIRDDIFVGRTGIQSFSDIFRLLPLGMGETDESIGYPMIKIYVSGKEIKYVLETLLLAYKFKGSNYHPRLSGIHLTYNTYRIPLDQIVEAKILKADGSAENIDFKDEKKLYSVGTLSYVGKFFWVIPEISLGLFHVTPKNANGQVIHDLKEAVVRIGQEEYKAWRAIWDHIRQLTPDRESGLPLIPTETVDALKNNMLEISSLSPELLFKNSTWIQISGFAIIVLSFFLIIFLFVWTKQKILARKS